MTIIDWIVRQSPNAPPALIDRMVAALGEDAIADEAKTAACCVAAAIRSLDAVLGGARFGREGAVDLLAIDALTTLAFEHASLTGGDDGALSMVARESAARIGRVVSASV